MNAPWRMSFYSSMHDGLTRDLATSNPTFFYGTLKSQSSVAVVKLFPLLSRKKPIFGAVDLSTYPRIEDHLLGLPDSYSSREYNSGKAYDHGFGCSLKLQELALNLKQRQVRAVTFPQLSVAVLYDGTAFEPVTRDEKMQLIELIL